MDRLEIRRLIAQKICHLRSDIWDRCGVIKRQLYESAADDIIKCVLDWKSSNENANK